MEGVLADSQAQRSQRPIGEVDLLSALRQQGLVEELVSQLRDSVLAFKQVEAHRPIASDACAAPPVASPRVPAGLPEPPEAFKLDPTRRYLCIEVLGGRAFLDHLQHELELDPNSATGSASALPPPGKSTFVLHLAFRGQRCRSRPALCACEPDLHDTFLFDLAPSKCAPRLSALVLSLVAFMTLFPVHKTLKV